MALSIKEINKTMTLTELQQRCSQIADHLEAAAIPVQAQFLSDHGSYWQGLPTHEFIPADGVPLLCRYDVKPLSMPFAWDQTAISDALITHFPALPFALTIDTYQRLDQHWWTGTMDFIHGGIPWRQIRTYDATGKVHQTGWHQVILKDVEPIELSDASQPAPGPLNVGVME